MSKFPNSNIFIPAVGGVSLLLGVAFAVSTVNYGNERIETLETSFERERASAMAEAERAKELAAALTETETSAEAEIAALVAFLGSLTGETGAAGRMGVPEAVPSG